MNKAAKNAETEPGAFTEEELHSSRIDQHKAQIDVLKHLATLNTATLLVVLVMVEKIFPTSHYRPLIGVGVLFLLASLVTSGLACLTVTGCVSPCGSPSE